MPDENDVREATILPYTDSTYNDRDEIVVYFGYDIGITIARLVDSNFILLHSRTAQEMLIRMHFIIKTVIGFAKGRQDLSKLMHDCRYTNEVDKKLAIFLKINAHLPKSLQVKIPSLITKDYVNRALDIVEERINTK